MSTLPIPANEPERLAALQALHILDTPPEERFDRITRLARQLFDVPISLISLIDADRQWFKSHAGLETTQTAREASFCGFAIAADERLVIPDATLDPRFANNPLVTGEPHIRFYAGQPLRSPAGYNLGTLCILDRRPRQISAAELAALTDLAAMVENELFSAQLNQALAYQRDSEARGHAIMDAMLDGLITADEHGLIQSFNSAAERLFGYSANEVIGQNLRLLMPEPYHSEHDHYLKRYLRTGEAHIIGLGREVRGRRKDGSILPIDLAVSELRLPDRRLFIGILRDITQRKQAEADLDRQYHIAENALSQMRAILDAASDIMILISPAGRVLTVNQSFDRLLFNGQPPDVVGRSVDDLQAEFESIFAEPASLKAFIAETVTEARESFTHLVSQRWPVQRELQIISTPVHTADSGLLGRLYVFRDVTHEREVDRMKTEFVALVSHELRTPLTSIQGYVDLLFDEEAGALAPDQRKYLENMRGSTDRLVALIDDLLDLSRIEAGRIDLDFTGLDINTLILEVAELLRRPIELKHQRLTLDLPPLPAVWIDPDRMTQVLINLLSNAYKYTPAGGSLTVRTREEDDRVRLDVSDTGIGLTPEEQAQVFNRFFRAHNRTTQEVSGTGLGLAIAKSIVEMHQGDLTVSSTPGIGTTFSLTLPIARTVAEQEFLPRTILPGARVLVVDDDMNVTSLVRRYLERAELQVFLARTGSEAQHIARMERPDLIILDLLLPDVDGFTVLEHLKNDPATQNIPIIIVSILPDSGKGRALGAVDFLIKPLRERWLLERVGRVLSGDQLRSVLLVDDDSGTRTVLSEHLHRAGYQVITATDGTEAVEVAKRERPDLVLMDIRMPRVAGLTALRMLRADQDTHDLPVVLMTASLGMLTNQRTAAKALGVSVLLSKPCTAEELAVAVARGLAGRRK